MEPAPSALHGDAAHPCMRLNMTPEPRCSSRAWVSRLGRDRPDGFSHGTFAQ